MEQESFYELGVESSEELITEEEGIGMEDEEEYVRYLMLSAKKT
jgi:hypothetical protein